MTNTDIVLVLGSSPAAPQAAVWNKPANLKIVAINNAWRIRPDWDYLVHAGDFPPERRPARLSDGQEVHSFESYVPAQNRFGGFVYAGGTMAFTTGYWALDFLKPRVLAFYGCDMVYLGENTHFYGRGAADPLRDDVTLRSLEAKSARLLALAWRAGCACVNLSGEPQSRLVFPCAKLADLNDGQPAIRLDAEVVERALHEEEKLGYMVEDGEYWHHMDRFDDGALGRIDALWLDCLGKS